jgi:hypothetical protein
MYVRKDRNAKGRGERLPRFSRRGLKLVEQAEFDSELKSLCDKWQAIPPG